MSVLLTQIWVILKERIRKKISTSYIAKYSYFSNTKDGVGKKAENDIFRNKTEITLDLLDEMGTTHSAEGNANSPPGKKGKR